MEKNNNGKIKCTEPHSLLRKTKKYILISLLGICTALPYSAYSQVVKFTLNLENITLEQLFSQIEKQSDYVFYYQESLPLSEKVSVKSTNETLEQILGKALPKNYSYKINNRQVAVTYTNPAATAQSTDAVKANTLRGTVKNMNGEPMLGVTVAVKGTTNGVTTNAAGNFVLNNVKIGDVLVYSYLGYQNQEFVHNGQMNAVVTIKEDIQTIEKVVVTAMGIKRSEKALGYSLQEVGADKFTTVKDVNVMSGLSGKVAGVQINNSAAGAGGAAKVTLRGDKSIANTKGALYVIDGMPMDNHRPSAAAGNMSTQPGTESIADINPDDIESINILPGPTGAALYGNEAANGVIIINTKKGAAGIARLTVSNSTTFSDPLMMPDFQNRYGNAMDSYQSWGSKTDRRFDPVKFFNTGVTVMNSVNLSTGTEKNQTYASAATTNVTGMIPNSKYNRYNFTVRNTSKFLNDKMSLDVSASYIMQDNQNMLSQGQYFNPLPALYLFPRGDDFDRVRMYEVWNEGTQQYTQHWPYGDNGIAMQNPYWITEKMLNESTKKRYMFSAGLKYQIFDWMDISGRVKVDNSHTSSEEKRYAGTSTTFASNKGYYSMGKRDDESFYGDIMLNINRRINDFRIQANIGASIKDNRMDVMSWRGGLRKGYNEFTIQNIATNDYKDYQDGSHTQSQGVFASVEGSYKGLLYLTVTGRNDWESNLYPSNYNSFFYPSVTLSAIVSDMVRLPEFVSFLKVRAGFTSVGSSYAPYLTKTFYDYDDISHTWSTVPRYPNNNLKPEMTDAYDLGFNARFFKNKLSVDFTYYSSDTFNQTFQPGDYTSADFSNLLVQGGQVRNSGFEVLVGYDQKFGNFRVSSTLTYTKNTNKIIELATNLINPATGEVLPDITVMNQASLGSAGTAYVRLTQGGSFGDIYINKKLREDMNGDIWVDSATGQVELVTTDYRKVGCLLPKYTMGWSNSLAWKSLSFGFLINARVGGNVISNTEAFMDYYGVSERSAKARDEGGVLINGGRVDAKTYYQVIGAGTGAGAYYMYSATNVRLQEVNLGYTLPRKWFNNKMAMTVSFVGRNLMMIYCKAPFDPDLAPSTSSTYYTGVDYFMQPSQRNLGFSVKMQF